jgi:hypothetical protein
LPNIIIGTYGFDNANQLTSISYMHGATTVGTFWRFSTRARRLRKVVPVHESVGSRLPHGFSLHSSLHQG